MFSLSKRSLSWFDSYLKGREQCVVINNIKFVCYKTETGIPLRNYLGSHPFQFNDLPEICPDIGLQMYADYICFSIKKVPATQSWMLELEVSSLNK